MNPGDPSAMHGRLYVRGAAGNRGPWHVLSHEIGGSIHAVCHRVIEASSVERRGTFPGELVTCVDCFRQVSSDPPAGDGHRAAGHGIQS